MADQNPFHVLGIDPAPLNALSDEQIFSIIQSRYRTLSRLYHPDVGETSNKRLFQQIDAAYTQLNMEKNAESFFECVERSVRSPRKSAKPIAELELKKEQVFAQSLDGLGRMAQYWADKIFGPLNIEEPDIRIEEKKRFQVGSQVSVFKELEPTTILLSGCLEELVAHRSEDMRPFEIAEKLFLEAELKSSDYLSLFSNAEERKAKQPKTLFDVSGPVYRLDILANGFARRSEYEMIRLNKGFDAEIPDEIRNNPEALVKLSKSDRFHSHAYLPSKRNRVVLDNLRIIGSLSSRHHRPMDAHITLDTTAYLEEMRSIDVYDQLPEKRRQNREYFYKSFLRPTQIKRMQDALLWAEHEPQEIHRRIRQEGFTMDEFLPWFTLLVPLIQEELPLVAHREDENGEVRFFILGRPERGYETASLHKVSDLR